jgi:hypothetical protein
MHRFLPKLLLLAGSALSLVLAAQTSVSLPIKRITPNCAGLTQQVLPQSRVLSAQLIPPGRLSIPGVTVDGFASLPEFCRVVVQSTPSSDSDIAIEVWMPLNGWNGRFLGTGNGGFGGALNYSQMANALLYGYATAGTDAGHASTAETDASFALEHPQKIIDFGYRAIHEMTLNALALIHDFYDKAPSHKYFSSCSDGGREALMEAQRYPTDYNGILAGDPANNWTGLLANGAQDLLALTASSASYIAASKLPAITAAVLARCNKGVETGYLNNPPDCHFNPQAMLCKGSQSDSCLTQLQIATLNQLYRGTTAANGALVFPGLTPGSEAGGGENGWEGWLIGSAPGRTGDAEYVQSYYADMVYQDAEWNYRDFNLSASLAKSISTTGQEINAVNPNLSGFRAANGKLILYHGWNDAAISPYSSIDYYNSIVAALGQKAANQILQLYMVPGMEHCQGGPGPTNFGAGGPGPDTPAFDRNHSIYKALEAWVEDGVVPKQVQTDGTTQYNGQTLDISRPLCPYPQIAAYIGSGSQNLAANYTCSAP